MHHFFVHFFAVTARLQRENTWFLVLWKDVNTRQRLSFSFPEHRYSLLEFNSRENCKHLMNWTRWKSAIKFETARLHFLSPLLLSVSTLKHYVHQAHHTKHKWINLKARKPTNSALDCEKLFYSPRYKTADNNLTNLLILFVRTKKSQKMHNSMWTANISLESSSSVSISVNEINHIWCLSFIFDIHGVTLS